MCKLKMAWNSNYLDDPVGDNEKGISGAVPWRTVQTFLSWLLSSFSWLLKYVWPPRSDRSKVNYRPERQKKVRHGS